TENLYFQSGT
nr:Chain C, OLIGOPEPTIDE SUBSTRATE FOR THE PROTEASE [unidentified]1LVB_D Chain D, OLIGOPEPTIDE SUBSTRATE FOR THE PROTEASE [unidentified]